MEKYDVKEWLKKNRWVYNILRELDALGEVSIYGLYKKVGASYSTVLKYLRILEREGLVEKGREEVYGRGRKYYRLTEKGRQFLAELSRGEELTYHYPMVQPPTPALTLEKDVFFRGFTPKLEGKVVVPMLVVFDENGREVTRIPLARPIDVKKLRKILENLG